MELSIKADNILKLINGCRIFTKIGAQNIKNFIKKRFDNTDLTTIINKIYDDVLLINER